MAKPSVRRHCSAVCLLAGLAAALLWGARAGPAHAADLFWASAPDAFEVLKQSGHLARHSVARSSIPANIAGHPVNDPQGYYNGFAVSGYGIMWNHQVLKKLGLPRPWEWSDLKKPIYFRKIGISAPSRSGTTHLIVETILQYEGWDRGWATLLEIAGNLATVTARSYGVPDGVNSGRFPIGLVIDFFGLSSQASGHPVRFVYPTATTLAPANIAIIRNAPPKTLLGTSMRRKPAPESSCQPFQVQVQLAGATITCEPRKLFAAS